MNSRPSEKRLAELKASKDLDAQIAELERMAKPPKEIKRKGDLHIITIPPGEMDPKGFIERHKEAHEIKERDIIQIFNF